MGQREKKKIYFKKLPPYSCGAWQTGKLKIHVRFLCCSFEAEFLPLEESSGLALRAFN